MSVPQSIPLDKIIATGRLREVDPDHALLIAASMNEHGLEHAISVRPHGKKADHYILICGAHRLEAAKLLEWVDIDAVVRNVTADEARLMEIDENFARADLTELDRAVFLAERKRIYEKLHPETRHGGARRPDQVAIFGDLAPRFSVESAERLGVSERSLQRTLARAALPADIRTRLAGTKLANKGSELDALLKMPADKRGPALDLILSGADDAPANVSAAAARLSGVRPVVVSDADAQFDALMKAWRRAGAPARERFAAFLDQQMEEAA